MSSPEARDVAEKKDPEPSSIVRPDSTGSGQEKERSAEVDSEGVPSDTPSEDEETAYPNGVTFLLLTVGLMAVVLVLALDNYIICPSYPRLG